jgi:glycosyltransferase involved in cell wall biosynthesis
MPSFDESFGLVAAETMSCGCALIASRTGFPASLKHEVEALLLKEPRTPYLAEAALRLIRNESLREQIARGGWSSVQSLRWEPNIKRVGTFYLEVLKMDLPS